MKEVNYQPTERGIYAFNKEYAGSSIVYYQSKDTFHEFIFLPGPSKFLLSFEDFTKAMKTEVLTLMEQLPKEIFEETVKIYLTCPTK